MVYMWQLTMTKRIMYDKDRGMNDGGKEGGREGGREGERDGGEGQG